jgi:hypothetical protein
MEDPTMPHPNPTHPWRRHPAAALHARRSPGHCVVCGAAARFRCDGPGLRVGVACGAWLCAQHRYRPAATRNVDYCPQHRAGC